MNLYQAGYYRRGKQGNNAGWGIVSPSKGMSQIAKDGFKGIAAKLVELKGTAGMPVVNIGIFQHDRFVYLMHVNYAAKGDDARGVTFVHGYCFNAADYYELCSKPDMICGMSESNFLMDYDSTVAAYPVAETLSYEKCNFTELLTKYRLNDAEYKKLVFGAINAIENYSNPLCIKIDLPPENYMQVFKEFLYLIMMGLPYHLRIKMSFFSFFGAGASVYISDHVEGNNYIDLDNREFLVDNTRLTQYHFTKIYNSFPAMDFQSRDYIFNEIAKFMNNAFESPLRDTGCVQVEAGFQAKVKKNDEGGISSEVAVELLTAFLRCGVTDHDEVYEYLAALLKVINDNLLIIQDEKILNRIKNKYEKTEREDYKKEVCRLIAREVMSQEEKSFDRLNRLYTSSKEQFAVVLDEIKNKNEEYYTEYYYESYLPYVLTNLEKLKIYLKEHEDIDSDEYKVLLSILNKLMKKELKEGFSYEQILQTRNKVKDLLSEFPKELEKRINIVWNHTHFVFWNCFNLDDFKPENITEYYKLKVEEIAREGYKEEECINAQKVLQLIELVDENDDEQICIKLYEIMFGKNDIWSATDKKNVQNLFKIKKEDYIDLNKPAGFDSMLALSYNYNEKKFDTINWGKKLVQKYQDAFEPFYISKMLKHSYVLKDKNIKEKFSESLQMDMKAAKKGEGVYCSKTVLKGLRRYSDSIIGKEIRSDDEIESRHCYANTIHRLFIGELPLVAIIVLMKEMIHYESMDCMTVFLLGITFFFLLVLLTGIKIYIAQGVECFMENHGIDRMPNLIMYVFLFLLVHTGVVFLCFVNDVKIIMICVLIYSILAVLSAITYNIGAED